MQKRCALACSLTEGPYLLLPQQEATSTGNTQAVAGYSTNMKTLLKLWYLLKVCPDCVNIDFTVWCLVLGLASLGKERSCRAAALPHWSEKPATGKLSRIGPNSAPHGCTVPHGIALTTRMIAGKHQTQAGKIPRSANVAVSSYLIGHLRVRLHPPYPTVVGGQEWSVHVALEAAGQGNGRDGGPLPPCRSVTPLVG